MLHISNTTTTLPYMWYHWATALTKEYPMSHIRVLICRVDDPTSDQMTQLAAFDFPAAAGAALQPETALDDLETTTYTTGNTILRRVLLAQWETSDATLVDQHRQAFSPRARPCRWS